MTKSIFDQLNYLESKDEAIRTFCKLFYNTGSTDRWSVHKWNQVVCHCPFTLGVIRGIKCLTLDG